MGISIKGSWILEYWKGELDLTLIHISMAAPPDLCTLGRCNLAAISGARLGPMIIYAVKRIPM
jgi:hypothetical protein